MSKINYDKSILNLTLAWETNLGAFLHNFLKDVWTPFIYFPNKWRLSVLRKPFPLLKCWVTIRNLKRNDCTRSQVLVLIANLLHHFLSNNQFPSFKKNWKVNLSDFWANNQHTKISPHLRFYSNESTHNYLTKQPTRNPQTIRDSQLRWHQTLTSCVTCSLIIWNGCTHTHTHGPHPCHFYVLEPL